MYKEFEDRGIQDDPYSARAGLKRIPLALNPGRPAGKQGATFSGKTEKPGEEAEGL